MFSGPVPPPEIIQEYDNLSPGAGQRILDDAHEDVVLDRQITREAFNYTIGESNIRVRLAVGITVSSFVGIFACLGFFDAPESIVGASVCGLTVAGPTIRAILDQAGRDDQPPATPPQQGTS